MQIGVPTLVYINDFDYNLASKSEKIINDKLVKSGLVFYDIESGIKSFNRLLNNSTNFKKNTNYPITTFQNMLAYPISKKQFLKNLNNYE